MKIKNKPSEVWFFNTYRKKWQWKRIDYDNAFRYQCVDLVRHFAVTNKYPVINYGDAIYIWRTKVWPGYQIVKNTLTNSPPVGALVFWWGGKYWHVAIAGKCNPLWLNVLEQNGWRGSADGLKDDAIRHVSKSYKNVLGWAIPII